MALNAKQQAFIEHYLTCWNATQAAILAGYSEKSARKQGSRMSTNVDIQSAVQARLTELKMSADEVLTRLTEHARGSVASFVRVTPSGDLRGFNLSDDKPLHLLHKISITTRTMKDDVSEERVSIELYDAQAALALLGKHHKLFVDKVEHTGADGQPLFKVYEKTDAFDPDDA